MKVVFGTDENGDSEPVIVEDIEVCVHLCSTYMYDSLEIAVLSFHFTYIIILDTQKNCIDIMVLFSFGGSTNCMYLSYSLMMIIRSQR